MQHARSVRKTVEISPQPLRGFRRYVGVEEETAELLACAKDFLAAVTVPARVGGGQVEELERTLQGTLEPAPLAGPVEPDGALHLAAHVPELLHEFKTAPGARGGPLVQRSGHVRQVTLPR